MNHSTARSLAILWIGIVLTGIGMVGVVQGTPGANASTSKSDGNVAYCLNHPGDHGDMCSSIRASLHAPATPVWMTRPCAEEDSVNCYWNAHQQGNGVGHSFFTRKISAHEVCRFYSNSRFAKHNDECFDPTA